MSNREMHVAVLRYARRHNFAPNTVFRCSVLRFLAEREFLREMPPAV